MENTHIANMENSSITNRSKAPMEWQLSALVHSWSKVFWTPKAPLEFVLPRIHLHTDPEHCWCPRFQFFNCLFYILHSHSFLNPTFLCILPELSCFMIGCLDHYSQPLLITTIFWETTSPPTVHHHLALLFSCFAVYPPASKVLTLLLGLQEFPRPTQGRDHLECIQGSKSQVFMAFLL